MKDRAGRAHLAGLVTVIDEQIRTRVAARSAPPQLLYDHPVPVDNLHAVLANHDRKSPTLVVVPVPLSGVCALSFVILRVGPPFAAVAGGTEVTGKSRSIGMT
jgi:hypothetical protein